MSQFNSNMIRSRIRITQARVFSSYICFITLFMFFPQALKAGPLSDGAMGELKTRLMKGFELSEVRPYVMAIEGEARSGGEVEKTIAINLSIELAASVLSTVDRTLPPVGTVFRTPNTEILGPQGAKIFAGTDPESVQDPVLRAAYKKLIQENDELFEKVCVESHKYEASEYALNAASRIIETSSNRIELLKSVQMRIEAMSGAPWAKEMLLSALIPNHVIKPTSDHPAVPNSPQKFPEPVIGKPIEQSPPAWTNPDSDVALEPRSLWPWIAVGAALMIVAWGMFKRHS